MCLQGFVKISCVACSACFCCVFRCGLQISLIFAVFFRFCWIYWIWGFGGGGPHGVKLTMPFAQKAIEFLCPKTQKPLVYVVWVSGEMYCFLLKNHFSGLRFGVPNNIYEWFFCFFFVKSTLFLTSDSLEMRPPSKAWLLHLVLPPVNFHAYFVDVCSFYCVFARFCVVCVTLTNCF